MWKSIPTSIWVLSEHWFQAMCCPKRNQCQVEYLEWENYLHNSSWCFECVQENTKMYEMWRMGERLSIYSYSQASYRQTFTVLRNGNEYSEIICEECGSKQGGKNSAIEFVAYNSTWSRIILASGIGINICGECIGGFVWADDSLTADLILI